MLFVFIHTNVLRNISKHTLHLNAHKLTRYAVQVRYPDDFYIPTIEDAKEAIRIAQKVKRERF
jgi:HEPN domain-containing protein